MKLDNGSIYRLTSARRGCGFRVSAVYCSMQAFGYAVRNAPPFKVSFMNRPAPQARPAKGERPKLSSAIAVGFLGSRWMGKLANFKF